MSLVSTESEQKLVECEALIDGEHSFMDVARALRRIRDEKLFVIVSLSLEDYCQRRWGFTRQRAHQLMQSYTAAEAVSAVDGLPPPRSERVARELSKAKTDRQRCEIWMKVHEGQEKVTAARVAQVRRELFGDERSYPKAIMRIEDMAKTIDTILASVQEVRKEHAVGHRAWITLTDRLGDSHLLLSKMSRM